ncbi:MAG: hypothetical protein K2R93_00350 [Gemmatimonadaceae bacterium]|nr:hypothetical protein [Gemmatimonadaceae bacterium]
MKRFFDYRVALEASRSPEGHSWAIREIGADGTPIGSPMIPFTWSASFDVRDIQRFVSVEGDGHRDVAASEVTDEADDEFTVGPPLLARVSDHLGAKLIPEETSFSHFGTSRTISKMSLTVEPAPDGVEDATCHVWGGIKHEHEVDFRTRSEDDELAVSLTVPKSAYERMCRLAESPQRNRAYLRLTGVSGFYAAWSPSITAYSIKTLVSESQLQLENGSGLAVTPPRLGSARRFTLSFSRQRRRSRSGTSRAVTSGDAATRSQSRIDEPEPGSFMDRMRSVERQAAIRDGTREALQGNGIGFAIEQLRTPLWIIVGLLALLVWRSC